jgi:hypothetical protein
MSDTPESNKAKIAFTSLFANDDAYWVPFKVSCKLERERDEARETAERYRLEANAMMMQRDRLIEVLQNIRTGWGGQKTAPECDYDDCKFLRPIDQALAAIKGEKNE